MAKKPRGDHRKHGYDGQRVEKTVEVENPYSYDRHDEVVRKNVTVSVADQMYAAKQIGMAQKAAFDQFEQLCVNARIGPSRALDPEQIRVDSSSSPDALKPVCARAIDQLNDVRREIGKFDYRIVELAALYGYTTIEIATLLIRKPCKQEDHRYIGKRFRDALTSLAEFFGLMAKSQGRRPIQGGSVKAHETP